MYGWKLNYGSIALMWRGGCIIRRCVCVCVCVCVCERDGGREEREEREEIEQRKESQKHTQTKQQGHVTLRQKKPCNGIF